MAKRNKLWKAKPAAKDFAAAESYLTLVGTSAQAKAAVQRLRRSRTVQHEAKDLLRASGLPLLSRDESQVDQDLKHLEKGKPLSPVLLLQGSLALGHLLVIADGYHRVCAAYYYDEDEPIACRIARASR
jgi:hypothetical protein